MESGTEAPALHRDFQALQLGQVPAQGERQLHTDRHLSVDGVELGEVGTDVADRPHPHGLGDEVRGDTEIGGDAGFGADADLGTVERCRGEYVDEVGHGGRLALQLRRRLRDEAQVRPRNDEREIALPAVSQRPEPDVGLLPQDRTDDPVELLLRAMTCVLRRQVDGEAREPHLLLGRQLAAAIHEYAADFRQRPDLVDDAVRDAGGVGEAGTGRQFHDEDRSCRIPLREGSRRAAARWT